MKLRSYFFGALACLALASCSSDDDAVASGEEFDPSKTHYVAINIVNPVETRAVSDGGFTVGSAAENKVESATIIFYDGSKNYLKHATTGHNAGDALIQWPAGDPVEENQPAVERVTKAVCVLTNLTSQPKYAIAILNTTLSEAQIKSSMTDLKAIIGNNTYNTFTEGKFVMTNSSYANNCEVELTTDNIQSVESNALLNPVVIHVERLAARVDVKQSTGGFTAQPEDIKVNGVDKTIKPLIKGFKVVGTNPDSYLIKNLTGSSSWDSFSGWSDDKNKRSYWATSAVPANYGYSAWNAMTTAIPTGTAASSYCLENTNAGNGYLENAQTATTLVLAAQLTVDENPIDLVRYAGFYYEADDFIAIVNNTLKNQKFTYSTTSLTDQKEWTSLISLDRPSTGVSAGNAAWTVVPKVNYTDITEFKKNGVTTTRSEIEEVIDGIGTAMYWNNGMTYYFVTVAHLNNDNDPETNKFAEYGVVRNHIYDITVSGTAGLGSPVFIPEEEIIPERPTDDESHVAAQIKILKWKIVQQHDVVLQ